MLRKEDAADEDVLSRLGANSVFKRELNTFTNFCVVFSVMCVPGTITSTLSSAWNNGGPAACTNGWLVSTLASWALGLAMAEITSALPTCGGPYYWASVLGKQRGPLFGWFTGWFSFIGEAALAGGSAASIVALVFSLMQVNYNYDVTPAQQLAIYTGSLILSGLIVSLPARALAYISAWGCFWIFCGIVIVCLTLPAVAPWRQSATFIFAHFNTYQTSPTGIRNNVYLFLENVMVAQYCVIGYDACAHMSEETTGAQKSVPRAIIMAVVASAVLGYVFLISLLLSIQDPASLTDGNANGFVAAQIFYDAFHARFGDGRFGTIMMCALPGSAVFIALIAITLSGSRMTYSFAKSGGIPFGRFFSVVNKTTHTPLRTVWLLTFMAFLFGLPLLKSQAAFGAVTAMANIALLVSYAIPIACRHTFCRNTFAHGPFTLGRYSEVVGWSGVACVAIQTCAFVLPTQYPVNVDTLDYGPFILFGVFLGCLIAWHLPNVGAKHWYKGPNVPSQILSAMNRAEKRVTSPSKTL
ncbi:hypothetical protein WJX73_009557 [Symbiochloris irregularis]|uniref:Amino acid transporter n=1 Tax=Symbiochloris irregularis TaxID=706552 RepID=A0AAW1PRF1_9CHLO